MTLQQRTSSSWFALTGEARVAAAPEFDAFYRTYYLRVLNFVERRLSDPGVAHEVCSECFVIAWRKFDPANPLPLVWLYRTARNLIGNAYRKREHEQQLLSALREQAALDVVAHEITILEDALTGLNPKDAEALRLTYWEQLSAADVGIVLGCSEQAAWARISRAKSALRKAMTAQNVERGGAQ